MGNKETQPRTGQIIRHGPNKGRVDMSFDPSEAKTPEGGGGVNVEKLLQEIRQVPRANLIKKRYKA